MGKGWGRLRPLFLALGFPWWTKLIWVFCTLISSCIGFQTQGMLCLMSCIDTIGSLMNLFMYLSTS